MHVWARCSVHGALRGPGWHTACIHGVAHSAHTGWHMACTWNGTQRALEIAHGEHHEVAQGAHMGWYTARTQNAHGVAHGMHSGSHTEHIHRVAHGMHTGWHTARTWYAHGMAHSVPSGSHTHKVAQGAHMGWHTAHAQGGTQTACAAPTSRMLGGTSSLEDRKGAVVPGARPPVSVQACARGPPRM